MLEPTDLLAELLDDSPEEMDLIKPVSTLLKLSEKEAAHIAVLKQDVVYRRYGNFFFRM